MKQIWKVGILVFTGFVALISSCTKDTFTEEDAFSKQQDLELLRDSLATRQEILRDSLQKVGGVINYSVATVLASDAAWYKPGSKGNMGLDGVVVTIAQLGKILSSTTDASGIATFKDLRIGTVNVNVKKTGYTEIDFVANLPALLDTNYVSAFNVVRHVGTMVPLFSLTTNLSTISGIATIETDLTNDAPEPAANVRITAVIDVDDSNFHRYIYYPNGDVESGCDECESWSFDYYGIIKQIAVHSAISSATTAADGSFTIQVPSTADGLPIDLFPSEYAGNQTLLQSTVNGVPVWGAQSIRTLYGPSTTHTYSTVPTIGTGAGQVQSAYVQFSAPTGTPAPQPTVVATATATITASGHIDVIQVINQGAGYAVTPTVEIVNPSSVSDANGFGTGGAATATVVDGKVTAITVTNAGSGYYVAPTILITIPLATMKAVAKCVVNSDGRITGVDFTGGYPYTKGYGYNAVPTVTFFPSVTGKGSGAKGVAILDNGQIDNVVMTNQGSGYIGRNYPTSLKNLTITPPLSEPILATAGHTYFRDIYFGTGKRITEQ